MEQVMPSLPLIVVYESKERILLVKDEWTVEECMKTIENEMCISLNWQRLCMYRQTGEQMHITSNMKSVIPKKIRDIWQLQPYELLFVMDNNRQLESALTLSMEQSNIRDECTRIVFGDTLIVQPIYYIKDKPNQRQLLCKPCADICYSHKQPTIIPNHTFFPESYSTFITDLTIIAGGYHIQPPPGYRKCRTSLNYTASGDYVFLCYKKGTTKPIGHICILDFPSSSSSSSSSSSLNLELSHECLPSYKKIPVDCNSGADSSTEVYVAYSYVSIQRAFSLDALEMAIDEIDILNDENHEQMQKRGFIRANGNLNNGCPTAKPLRLYYHLSPVGGVTCCCEEKTCLFQPRLSKNKMILYPTISVQHMQILSYLRHESKRLTEEHQTSFFEEGKMKLESIIKSRIDCVKIYEDKTLQTKALSFIPLQRLKEKAALINSHGWSSEDLLLKQLIHWFKTEFFTWTDKANCEACGNKNTIPAGNGVPSAEDLLWGGNRVELYQCPVCNSLSRFVRYNHPEKLLHTRTGRCGEWANCFTLCCRSLGYEARYILDVTDHVWTEVYSQSFQRWLHCDPCEDAIDKPLLYEIGWGKKLSYVLAFSLEEVIDVTKRYVKDWDETIFLRLKAPEKWLEETLNKYGELLLTERNITKAKLQTIRARKLKEIEELNKISSLRNLSTGEMTGRISGAKEWRESRKETGTESIKKTTVTAIQPQKTKAMDMKMCLKDLFQQLFHGCRYKDCRNPLCRKTLSKTVTNENEIAALAIDQLNKLQQRGVTASIFALHACFCQGPGHITSLVFLLRPILYWQFQENANAERMFDYSSFEHDVSNGCNPCPSRRPFNEKFFGVIIGNNQCLSLSTKDEILTEGVKDFTFLCGIRVDDVVVGSLLSDTLQLISFPSRGFSIELCANLTLQISTGIFQKNCEKTFRSIKTLRVGHEYCFSLLVHRDEILLSCDEYEILKVTATEIDADAWGGISRSCDIKHFQEIVLGSDKQSSIKADICFCHVSVFDYVLTRDVIRDFDLLLRDLPKPKVAFRPHEKEADKMYSEVQSALKSRFLDMTKQYVISVVRLWHGQFIEGIEFGYMSPDDSGIQWCDYCTKGKLVHQRRPESIVNLRPGEFIVAIFGQGGNWLDAIGFVTNLGRRFRFGGDGGDAFHIPIESGHEIRLLAGLCGDFVDRIAAITVESPIVKKGALYNALQHAYHDYSEGEGESEKVKNATVALNQYISNLLKNPTNPKFRRIRASNAFMMKTIGSLKSALAEQLMKYFDFELQISKGDTESYWVCNSQNIEQFHVLHYELQAFLHEIADHNN